MLRKVRYSPLLRCAQRQCIVVVNSLEQKSTVGSKGLVNDC